MSAALTKHSSAAVIYNNDSTSFRRPFNSLSKVTAAVSALMGGCHSGVPALQIKFLSLSLALANFIYLFRSQCSSHTHTERERERERENTPGTPQQELIRYCLTANQSVVHRYLQTHHTSLNTVYWRRKNSVVDYCSRTEVES